MRGLRAAISLSLLAWFVVTPLAALAETTSAARDSAVSRGADAKFETRLQKIDAMVNESMSRSDIPGYCLTVIKDGNVVFEKPYGSANRLKHEPVTSDTVFGLASLTKTFTAMTLLALVDRGLVDLDAPLSKYLPGLTPEYRGLTIRELASMTAGVPKKVSPEVDWKDQLDILDHTPLVSKPGSKYLYSNFSYRLLGSVIKNVTGRPYLEVVKEVILQPLKMEDTATTVLLDPTGRVAQAYGDGGGNGTLHPIEYKSPSISFSAGMLASTQNDLKKYVLAMMSRKILSPAGYKTLWVERPPLTTGEPSPWAFGWHSAVETKYGNQRVVTMNGGTPGVASMIMMIPDAHCAVISLCNLRKPASYKITKDAFAMAFGGEGDADDGPEPDGSQGE